MQIRSIIAASLLVGLASCANSSSDSQQEAAPASTNDHLTQADSASFSSGIGGLKSPSRKYIRTADIRCRVDDVFKVTTELERLVTSLGGIIERSEITNDMGDTRNVFYNADSVRQVQAYTTTAALTLRVPVAAVDSVVRFIPQISAFVDRRTLAQSDVTLSYMANAMKNRDAEADSRPAELVKKTKEAIDAQKYEDQKKEAQIDRRIENLSLLDQSNFATINVAFYQPQRVSELVVADPARIAQAPFNLRFVESLLTGVQVIQEIFFFLLRFWTLWLAIIGGWLIYRRMQRSRLLG